MILYDFECPVHGLFEELVKSGIHQIPCPQCGRTSNRQISAVHIDRLGMAVQEGATPTSLDYFEKVHKERRAIEDRNYERHGDYGAEAGGDGGRGYPVVHDPV
jgi:putative FmdB family regulatory protein